MSPILFLFSFYFYFFKWRRTMFTFFYFLTEIFYFSFYFSKFRKKIRSTKFLYKSYRLLIVSHTGDHGDIVKFRRSEKIPLFSRFWISEKIKLSKITPRWALLLFCVPRRLEFILSESAFSMIEIVIRHLDICKIADLNFFRNFGK